MATFHLPPTSQFMHPAGEEPFFHGLANGGPPMALRPSPQLDPPQTLSTASHEQLLASGNQAYHLLFVQKTILEGKLQQAEQIYTDLLRNAQSIQLPVQPGVVHPSKLPQDSFPHISFQTQRDWTSYKTGMQNEAGLSGDQGPGSCDYIEHKDGTPVSSQRAEAIRRNARELFAALKVKWENSRKSIPETWGKMPHGNKVFFRQTMKEHFPELGFCEDDWKCEYLATQQYPGWHRTHCKGAMDSKQQSTQKNSCSAKSLTPVPNVSSGHSHLPPAPSPTLSDTPEGPTFSTAMIPPTSVPSPRSDLNELRLSPPTATLAPTTFLSPPTFGIELRSHPSPTQEIDGASEPSHPHLNLAPGQVHPRSPSPGLPSSTSSTNLQPCSAAGLTPVTQISAGTDASLHTTATPVMPPQPESAPNHPIQVVNPFPPPSGGILQYMSPTRQLPSRHAKKAKETETGPSKRGRARASKMSLTPRNLFMIEYLKENPDTTTDEFDKVWRMLNADTKEGWNKKSKGAKAAATATSSTA